MRIPTSAVRIVEVGPRDGLQNIKEPVSTTAKLELIRRLESTGLRTIELTSVVSPRAIPQLADCREVLSDPDVKRLHEQSTLRLPVLVPNIKGLDIAIQHGVKEVAVFVSATEGFSKANINCTVQQGLERARNVTEKAIRSNISVRGYVSCIFADPFDGPTKPSAVLHCVKELLDMGCYEVSLGDTLGVGSPSTVRSLIAYLAEEGVPLEQLAGHFHDTYGQAVANVWEAYQCGLRVFDSSVGGLGGCPFAPGAKGNVGSEDLVYMFHNAGVDTGVDLLKLVETGVWISRTLSKTNASRAGTALAIKHGLLSQPHISGSAPSTKPALPWSLVKDSDGLLVHRSGVNLKVTLNRPKNGNALTATMIPELTSVFENSATDPSISRIVVAANGKFFCTGMDLGKGTTPVAQGGSASDAQFERLTRLFDVIDRCPKVTIACVNGPAFGGGVGLAFCCDIRIMTKNATMTLSEVKLGICASTISRYVIREWGLAFSRQALLSARPVAARELKGLGIVSEIVEDKSTLDSRLDELLVRLKVASPDASRMSKEIVRLAWAHAGDETQAAGIKEIFDTMMRPDKEGAHGVREFQAGRKVDWDAFTEKRTGVKL